MYDLGNQYALLMNDCALFSQQAHELLPHNIVQQNQPTPQVIAYYWRAKTCRPHGGICPRDRQGGEPILSQVRDLTFQLIK